MEQFITAHINGQFIHKTIKIFTPEEMKKTNEIKEKLDNLEKRWFDVANGKEMLVD